MESAAKWAVGVVKLLKEVQEMPNLIREIGKNIEYSTTIASSVDRMVNVLNSSKYGKIDKEHEIKDLKCHLKNAAVMIHRYVDSVDDIFHYGCEDNTIVDALIKNDFNPLRSYLKTLQMRISHAMEAHKAAQDACSKVRSQSATAAKFCECKEQDAKTKKRLTKEWGGVLTGVAAVGGVGGSIIGGLVTFGLGTTIEIGITAVVVPAVVGFGAAITEGVATHLLTSNYKELERNFKNMSKDLNDFINISSAMVLQLDKLHSCTISIAKVISKDLHYSQSSRNEEVLHCSQSSIAVIIGAVRALLDTISKSSEMSSLCLQKLEELKSEVEHI